MTGWVAAVLLNLALCVSFSLSVQAQPASPWSENDHAGLRLVSAVDATGERETLSLGLEFRMVAGWKIYWRSPGDAGFPPTIDWGESSNLASVAIHWPVPQRYEIFGLTTYVYQDSVILPLTVTLRETAAPLALHGKIAYLLCDRICIPYEAEVSLALPAGQAGPTEFAPLIARFQARVPRQIMAADGALGLTIERSLLTWHAPRNTAWAAPQASDRATLEVLARSAEPFTQPDLLVEGPSQMSFGAPRVDLSEGGKLALLRIPVSLAGSSPSLLATPPLTLTLIDGTRAVEQRVTPQGGGTPGATSPLFGILLLALLGGFILNFMPCVLPVLSLKLMNAMTQSGRGAGQVRASFLATAMGIVFSLAVLGGIVIALKSAGIAVGWGVQFQQPIFLTVMALVVTLFAANLWGLFTIALPQAIGEAASRAPGPGQGTNLSGDFATGLFATLLATPCSAPFLGTAVGFALTRGATEILAVFSASGIGLALPYLAVAAMPGLARWLPKSGAWMIGLRRILGAVLIATAAWLITVLSAQSGWPMALAVAAVLVAALAGLLIRHRVALPSLVRSLAGYGVIMLAVVTLALPFVMRNSPQPLAAPSRAWQQFDRVQVFNAVAQGKVVLVDVTADWCITCQANKALVLDRGAVRARIEEGRVLALRADWTRPNAAIAEYLASFGRYGIPFNAVYGPGAPSGIALPELLRDEDVLAAFDKAAKPVAAAGGG